MGDPEHLPVDEDEEQRTHEGGDRERRSHVPAAGRLASVAAHVSDGASASDARPSATRVAPWVAIGAVAVGVFSTWTRDGSVTLSGVQGPDNGWLVLIVAGFALGWTRAMARGSWTGVVGVFGAATVMAWTAVENWLDSRDVLGATAEHGLLLVIAGSLVLAGAAVARAVELSRASSAARTTRSGPG